MKVLKIVLCLVGILFLTSVPASISPVSTAANSDLTTNDFVPISEVDDIEIANNSTDRVSEWSCDTTVGSPRLHDIDPLASKVQGRRICWHHNLFGSKCTRIADISNSSGTYAVVSICGKVGKVPCAEVANGIRAIKKMCTWRMYAGGRYWPDKKLVGRWVALHK